MLISESGSLTSFIIWLSQNKHGDNSLAPSGTLTTSLLPIYLVTTPDLIIKSFESIELVLFKIYLSFFVSFSNIPRLYVFPSKVLISVLLSITPLINLDE